ncbi:MAG: 4Fe-4S binding protein [Proteobacteria bacterium]|nr:4Fe-4S binding protein [Pseudomonadota bacterium]
MPKFLSIDTKRCKSCGLCLRACPRDCLKISTERNRAGYLVIQLVKPQNCIACGLCVRTCPEPACLIIRE